MQNKKLEELFDLPKDEESPEPTVAVDEESLVEVVTTEAMNNLEKIDAALPSVRGLEAGDAEMDELAELAKNSYKDLIDLGMNVDARHATDIFSSASQFLGHAITAKNAKINKKLKMLEIQLKKAKLDSDVLKKSGDAAELPDGQGQILDRNELLAEILSQANAIESDKKS